MAVPPGFPSGGRILQGDSAGHSQQHPQPGGWEEIPQPRTHRVLLQISAKPCTSTHNMNLTGEFGFTQRIFCHNNPIQQLRMAAPGCLKCVTFSSIRARLTTKKPITNKSMGQSSSQRLGAETPFLPVNGCGSCSNHKALPNLLLQKSMEHLCFPRPRHYRQT